MLPNIHYLIFQWNWITEIIMWKRTKKCLQYTVNDRWVLYLCLISTKLLSNPDNWVADTSLSHTTVVLYKAEEAHLLCYYCQNLKNKTVLFVTHTRYCCPINYVSPYYHTACLLEWWTAELGTSSVDSFEEYLGWELYGKHDTTWDSH